MIAGMRVLACGSLLFAGLVAGCGSPQPAPRWSAPQVRRVEPPSDPGLPAAARRALEQRFPTLHAIGHASGHLQVDDADDLAVVLAPIGQTRDAIVAVLVTGTGGDERVVTVSRPVAPGCDACTVTVDIAHRLLSVHAMRPDFADFERITWQFGYRDSDDALRLVGVTAAQPAGNDPIAHSYAISTDLLSGVKVDTLDAMLTEPGRRRELRSTVPLRPAIAFDGFGFDAQALEPELRRRPVAAFEAKEPLPAAAVALLRARFPGMTVQARSTGALRKDGARDLAVVLAPAAGSGADTFLALLLAQPNSGLRLAATSGPVTRTCSGCEVQVQIAHQALVVQTKSADEAGTQVVGWQFAAMPADPPGALRLVGVRTVLATRGAGGDARRYVNTTNLVTGDKLDMIEDVEHGRRRRVERASNVPLRPPLRLTGFTFDTAKLDAETRRDFKP